MTDQTQEPSLTERLAAKLGRGECVTIDGERMVYLVRAKRLLPLLLSEPELVASLPDEVRLSVMEGCTREQIENALTALWHKQKGIDPETGRMWLTPLMERGAVATSLEWSKEDRRSVLTPRERMALEIGLLELGLSKAEAKALTPEVPRVG